MRMHACPICSFSKFPLGQSPNTISFTVLLISIAGTWTLYLNPKKFGYSNCHSSPGSTYVKHWHVQLYTTLPLPLPHLSLVDPPCAETSKAPSPWKSQIPLPHQHQCVSKSHSSIFIGNKKEAGDFFPTLLTTNVEYWYLVIPCAASADAQVVAVDDGRQILWGNHNSSAAAASTYRSLTPLRLPMWYSIKQQ